MQKKVINYIKMLKMSKKWGVKSEKLWEIEGPEPEFISNYWARVLYYGTKNGVSSLEPTRDI
jgi:hypothetical protein